MLCAFPNCLRYPQNMFYVYINIKCIYLNAHVYYIYNYINVYIYIIIIYVPVLWHVWIVPHSAWHGSRSLVIQAPGIHQPSVFSRVSREFQAGSGLPYLALENVGAKHQEFHCRVSVLCVCVNRIKCSCAIWGDMGDDDHRHVTWGLKRGSPLCLS